jgi:hypothetical protein
LVVSEYSEALEGYRKSLMDDKLPQYPGLAVELIDAVIRTIDVIGGYAAAGTRMQYAPRDFSSPGPDIINDLYTLEYQLHRGFLNLREQTDRSLGESGLDVARELYRLGLDTQNFVVMHDGEELIIDVRACISTIACTFALAAHVHPELDLFAVYDAKMAYNAQRVDHTDAARLAAGGKRF